MNQYRFTNNGFRIIMKPMSAMLIFTSVVFIAVCLFMGLSGSYSWETSLKVLLMIPAINAILFLFMSVYFVLVYFTFTIDNDKIVIKKWFQTIELYRSDIIHIQIDLLVDGQNKIVVKTVDRTIKLYILGQGARAMYDEFFYVLKEISTV